MAGQGLPPIAGVIVVSAALGTKRMHQALAPLASIGSRLAPRLLLTQQPDPAILSRDPDRVRPEEPSANCIANFALQIL